MTVLKARPYKKLQINLKLNLKRYLDFVVVVFLGLFPNYSDVFAIFSI